MHHAVANLQILMLMRISILFIWGILTMSEALAQSGAGKGTARADSVSRILFQKNTHPVVLDSAGKIISWITPRSGAYDIFLRKKWEFIKTGVPAGPGPSPRSDYPQYYFYCAYRLKAGKMVPDTWMNDVGEKIPNWFESARLYYAYTGDSTVMTIVQDLIDYTIDHGTSPSSFSWPDFPYTTTNAGDTLFRGFTSAGRFALHEVQVDHAGDMGLTYYRLYQYTGKEKYKDAAVGVANTLEEKIRTGSAIRSPWPYRVKMNDGFHTAEYGANWIGCYSLLDELSRAHIGRIFDYRIACDITRKFLLEYPMKTGYWTDGHTDNAVNSNTYRSNMSASNMTLYLLDHPGFDPDWKKDIPMLIAWTEKYFVFRSADGEASTMWGANIVGEQDDFNHKMSYQTARYAAECAGWYAISRDETYKEKAYRALNWVTYCMDSLGRSFESPLSDDISNWWSDCYGEGPRMFYKVFAGIPEFAPPHENHILYSEGVLRQVSYGTRKVRYTAVKPNDTEFLRLAFKPTSITLDGVGIPLVSSDRDMPAAINGYSLKDLGGGDFAIEIRRAKAGRIIIE